LSADHDHGHDHIISISNFFSRTGASMEIGSVLSSQESRVVALQNTVNSIQSAVASLQGQVDVIRANCTAAGVALKLETCDLLRARSFRTTD